MSRPLRLLNVALGLVALLLLALLVKTWVVPVQSTGAPASQKPLQEPIALASPAPSRLPLAHFDLLLERTMFRQPPPVVARLSPPPPPPPPPPTLLGTIVVDHERRAVLSDKGKANLYTIGQEVAGGTVTQIVDDRVWFRRGENVTELTLKAPIQPGTVTPPPATVISPASPPPASPVVPSPRPPTAIEGSPAPSARSPGGAK